MQGPAEAELQTLLERFPLPVGVGRLETFADHASVNGVEVRLAGIATEFGGECATGSAASLHELPLLRAYMELVERVAILAAMQRDQAEFVLRDRLGDASSRVAREIVFPTNPAPTIWRWARSSGVAVGPTWGDAAARAA